MLFVLPEITGLCKRSSQSIQHYQPYVAANHKYVDSEVDSAERASIFEVAPYSPRVFARVYCYTTHMYEAQFIASKVLIGCGCLLQVVSAIRFLRFFASQRDAASGNHEVDQRLGFVVGVLIMCFVPAYVYILVAETPDIWIGALLFAGVILVAIALEWISHLVESVRTGMRQMAQTLVTVMETSDDGLQGHSRHVQNLSLLLYDSLPMEQRNLINREDLSYAALFHDIGKLSISDFILQKPGKLDKDEIVLMRDHPQVGAQILRTVDSFVEIAEWVRYHHERIDGTGYYHVPGDQIPFASRLIAVTDTYSAITMRRSYSDPTSHEYAIGILRDVAGTQLDANLVEAFCSLPRDEVLDCAPSTIEIVRNT